MIEVQRFKFFQPALLTRIETMTNGIFANVGDLCNFMVSKTLVFQISINSRRLTAGWGWFCKACSAATDSSENEISIMIASLRCQSDILTAFTINQQAKTSNCGRAQYSCNHPIEVPPYGTCCIRWLNITGISSTASVRSRI